MTRALLPSMMLIFFCSWLTTHTSRPSGLTSIPLCAPPSTTVVALSVLELDRRHAPAFEVRDVEPPLIGCDGNEPAAVSPDGPRAAESAGARIEFGDLAIGRADDPQRGAVGG